MSGRGIKCCGRVDKQTSKETRVIWHLSQTSLDCSNKIKWNCYSNCRPHYMPSIDSKMERQGRKVLNEQSNGNKVINYLTSRVYYPCPELPLFLLLLSLLPAGWMFRLFCSVVILDPLTWRPTELATSQQQLFQPPREARHRQCGCSENAALDKN